jgi:hypothetical protein
VLAVVTKPVVRSVELGLLAGPVAHIALALFR